MRQVDLLIIGSGPAGCSTALHLARLDPALARRTVILEKAEHPRHKLCGGGLGHSLFANGDSVIFNDSSDDGGVTLVGQARPAAVTFDNSVTDFTITPIAANIDLITGAASITKLGTATATLTWSGTTRSLNIKAHCSAGRCVRWSGSGVPRSLWM